MLKRLSLRWRLSLFYAGLSSAILFISGAVFFIGLQNSLHQMLDAHLRDAANLAATQLSDDENPPKFSDTDTSTLQNQVSSGTTLVVYNNNGHVSDKLGSLKITAPLTIGFKNLSGYRSYTLHLQNGEWVQALRSETETLETLARAQRLLLLTIPLMLLAGLGMGYVMTDRALRPVDAVTQLAMRIASNGFYKERLPAAPGEDEMTRLTSTVNSMLAKLEQTIERERAFALAAAHELRTPLALLRGQTSLSLYKNRTAEEYRNTIEKLDKASSEMNDLVENLLTLVQTNQSPELPNINFEDINLEDMTNALVQSEISTAQKKSIQLKTETQTAFIRANPTLIRLLITNLLSNAIKYGREHGRVWIRTGTAKQQPFLEISDDGPGIADSELERLTQPFQRGLGMQSIVGSGLGLTLVSAICQQHQAKLKLGKAKEGGLCATVFFPKPVGA